MLPKLKGFWSMKLLILIILLLGCGVNKPAVSIPPVVAPIILPLDIRTPIREMDLLHQGMRDSTVALVKVGVDGGDKVMYPYCTGVWVGVDEILTASHCVKEDDKPWETPVGNEVTYVVRNEIDLTDWARYHHGTVISYDEGHDLVLVQVKGIIPSHGVALLALSLPAVGETVYSVGNPNKLYWSFMQGEVSAYRRISTLGDIIQVNMSIWYGHSGGGLFDYRGKLIGICVQRLEIPSMGNFVHLDNIRKFLDEAHLGRK